MTEIFHVNGRPMRRIAYGGGKRQWWVSPAEPFYTHGQWNAKPRYPVPATLQDNYLAHYHLEGAIYGFELFGVYEVPR